MSQAAIELETVGENAVQPASTRKAEPKEPSLHEDQSNQRGAHSEAGTPPNITKKTTAIVIFTVTFVNLISTFLAGILTVAIPTIARDIDLDQGLILWPASIYALVSACTLLLAGSISDAIGSRFMYLLGCFLQSIFTMAVGLSRTGTQIITFRGISGLALSCCLPSAVSIITSSMPTGKRRNIAFAAMGGAQPFGFSLGLVLGGVLTDYIGWRWGFYIGAIMNIFVFAVALWGLPRESAETRRGESRLTILKTEVDWVGALIATVSLALLSYTFAAITSRTSSMKSPGNIVILCIALLLIPAFAIWMRRQVKLGRPALIPNNLWKTPEFTTICISVFFVWATFNGLEQLSSIYFQYIQGVSPLGTSLRFLPAPISGVLSNIVVGLVVHKMRADYIVLVGNFLILAPPLLMALTKPQMPYWAMEFPAMLLSPSGADSLFVVSNLLITSLFPEKTHGLAGGVFQTVSQIGKSMGLALTAVLANTVAARHGDKNSVQAMLEGYRSAFWFCFALNAVTFILCIFGLRKIGKVGLKRD